MDGSDMFTIAGFQYGDIYYSILLDLYMFDDFNYNMYATGFNSIQVCGV
jgi:hypothetical protein